MYYALTVQGTLITDVHQCAVPFKADQFSNNPIYKNDTLIAIESEGEYKAGTDLRAYNDDGIIEDLVSAISLGYIPMPPNKEIVNGELVDMNIPIEEQPITIKQYLAQLAEETKTEIVEQTQKKFVSLKPVISDLLENREAEVVLGLQEFIVDWKPGPHKRGLSVMWNLYPYKIIQTHDSTENVNWTPDVYQSGFAPWHGTTPETALPWMMPRHAEENYLPGEYMMYDDGLIYLSQRNTNFTPEDVPTDWWVQYENGEFGPIDGANEEEPVDPEIPVDKNSNGTDAWSEWVPWNSHPATLYNIGDRVTLDGARYIATLNGNHWSPTSGTGWAVAPE